MSLAPARFNDSLLRENIVLPPAIVAGLARYVDGLLAANRKFNLTAVTDPGEVWQRHILESLALVKFLGGAARVVDIGSGPGIPGLPMAMAMGSSRFCLVESVAKKAGFIASMAKTLMLDNVEVLAVRAEAAGRHPAHRAAYDAVVIRGVGRLAELVELALPLLRLGGRLLAVKGRSAAAEIEAAGQAIALLGGRLAGAPRLLAAADNESVVVEITKESDTPDIYPRRAGMPGKRPLGG